jgi:hypothetical protein
MKKRGKRHSRGMIVKQLRDADLMLISAKDLSVVAAWKEQCWST